MNLLYISLIITGVLAIGVLSAMIYIIFFFPESEDPYEHE